ncbi:DUF2207 domain-containing protein, partial [Candidatus Saccharibacteria bacterium]|nr:DUF2207 domain-containing protein [Candidatus Saccharibacteria bacterium]
MKKLHSLIFTVLLLASSILPVAPVFADVNSFHFKDLTIDYNLHKTSTNTSEMEVVETFTAEFPNYNQNHGIERIIPFLNQNDTNLTMENADRLNIEVTRNGKSEPYTVKTGSNNFTVRIGSVDDYVKGEQIYVLKYKFINVITEFDESRYSTDPYQELYWDSNGTGWAQNFENVTVNLHMDPEIKNTILKDREISYTPNYKSKSTIHKNNQTAEKLAAWCYVGSFGSSNQDRCKIKDLNDGVQYKTTNLAGGENMTIVLNFNNDTFVVPENNFVKNLNFKDAKIDYYLSRDENGKAILKIKEDFTALFPTINENRSFTRFIPFVNVDKNRFITPDQNKLDITITMDGKTIEPYLMSTIDGGYFDIVIHDENDGYIHGEHQLTFEYTLEDLVEPAEGQLQELSLDVFGEFFAYDISNAKVTMHIDQDLMSEIVTGSFTDLDNELHEGKTICLESGALSYTERCDITETEDGYTYVLNNIAGANSMSLIIYFKDGTFKISEPNRNYLVWHIFGVFIVVAIIVSITGYFKTYRKVADKIKYLKSLPVVPQYTPIKDLTVAEIGQNYLGPVKNLKVATMLELIINKKIELRKEQRTGFLSRGYKWFFKVVDITNLSLEQQDLLAILNGGKRIDRPSDQEIEIKQHGFSSKLEDAFDNYDLHVKHSLKSADLLEKSKKETTKNSLDSVTKFFRFFGIIFVVSICLQIALPVFTTAIFSYAVKTNFTQYAIFEGLFLIPIMIVLAIIIATVLPLLQTQAERYKLRTMHGLEISRYTDGLKLYIKMAEADRLKFLQSVEGVDTSEAGIVKLYEKLLPYAALFGLEKSWMKELEKYYQLENITAPTWYDASFSYAALSSVMHSATYRPIDTSSSSGGSWSSGGGFSSSSGSSGGGGGG